MVACISQSYNCFEETLNTLNYSARATSIKRRIARNVREDEQLYKYKEVIMLFKNEFEMLRKILLQPFKCGSCGFLSKDPPFKEAI